jgi:dihydroorotate dehydrogenase electron transfer subunit
MQQRAKIVWNRRKGPGYYHTGLSCHGFDYATPGQFVMVQVSQNNTPLLRRPFSIYNLESNGDKTTIELLYKVVGTGTKLLSKMAKEDTLDILGPLGNGFSLNPPAGPIYLAGGGIGVPPLFFLASTLHRDGYDMSQCHAFLGGRSRTDLLCQDEFKGLGLTIHLTTDDGSAGQQCLITSPLEQAIAQTLPSMLYACGPLPMLACIVGIRKKYNVPCQVSVETMMACGIGACLGCAVPKADGSGQYLHACQNGPVFDADQIDI